MVDKNKEAFVDSEKEEKEFIIEFKEIGILEDKIKGAMTGTGGDGQAGGDET